MRARDSRHRADELAAVVAWMARRAAALEKVAASLGKEQGEVADIIGEQCGTEAALLRRLAGQLERGEHHA